MRKYVLFLALCVSSAAHAASVEAVSKLEVMFGCKGSIPDLSVAHLIASSDSILFSSSELIALQDQQVVLETESGSVTLGTLASSPSCTTNEDIPQELNLFSPSFNRINIASDLKLTLSSKGIYCSVLSVIDSAGRTLAETSCNQPQY